LGSRSAQPLQKSQDPRADFGRMAAVHVMFGTRDDHRLGRRNPLSEHFERAVVLHVALAADYQCRNRELLEVRHHVVIVHLGHPTRRLRRVESVASLVDVFVPALALGL